MTITRVEMGDPFLLQSPLLLLPERRGRSSGRQPVSCRTIFWEKIIGGLEEIDYKNGLILNYYNEPLADRSILDRIREAARLGSPHCRIMI